MRHSLDFFIARMRNDNLRENALDFSTTQFMNKYHVTREKALKYHVLAIISYANTPERLKVTYKNGT